jgi:hypothetical protein
MATKRGPKDRAVRHDDETTRPDDNLTPSPTPAEKRQLPPARAVIEHVRPQVDCGRRPAKATVGDMVRIEADVFADGHDLLRCEVRYRHDTDAKWSSAQMTHTGNDHWRAVVPISCLGSYRFSVRAKLDQFATW